MQKNDFEKNVRQRMDELQLYPSAELWPEVERRIRKEKKRRWFIFWILFPLLLAGTGIAIYLLSATTKKSISSVQSRQPIQQPVQQTINEEKKKDTLINDRSVTTMISNDNPDSKNEIATVAGTINDRNKKDDSKTERNRPAKKDQPFVSFESRNGGKKKNKINPVDKVDAEPSSIVKKEEIIPADTIVTMEEEDPIVVTAIKPRNEVPKTTIDSTDRSIVQVTPDDSVKTSSNPVVQTTDSSTNTDPPEPLEKKNNNKWKTGVTLIAGLSNRAGGIDIGNEKSYDFAAGPGLGNPGLAAYSKNAGRPGLFWEVGVYIQKNSKKRTSVSFGLSVSSFAHGQQIGSSIATLSDGRTIYLPGRSSVYHNRYFYLQLPMMLHWELKKTKRSLVWQNGFSPSLLLGSNALVHNPSSDIYYRDKSTLSKIQLAFRSGLYGRFATASGHPLSAGVFFNYNLTGFQNKIPYDRNHHLSFGVQFMMQLKKD